MKTPKTVTSYQAEVHDDLSDGFHSDSGISVRDDSPARLASQEADQSGKAGPYFRESKPPDSGDQKSRQAAPIYPLPTNGPRRWSTASDSAMGSSVDEHCAYDQPGYSPESYYSQPSLRASQHLDDTSLPYALPNMSVPSCVPKHPHQLHSDQPVKTMAGYEHLASRLSSNSSGTDNLTPIYRKFETLNHRILLYLQDEISEIEEDLRYLDEADAQAYTSLNSDGGMGGSVPASRRCEARMPSEIHFRRLDLLGRAFVKVGQYSELVHPHNAGSKCQHKRPRSSTFLLQWPHQGVSTGQKRRH